MLTSIWPEHKFGLEYEDCADKGHVTVSLSPFVILQRWGSFAVAMFYFLPLDGLTVSSITWSGVDLT